MVGKQNSTILTVSYGTFSCTLEGFDDSFGMMKAIAEYFRDLAADDRFFGAEPPTPDADMLAKIAEQEVSRRVEAVSKDGAVTLRPYQIEEAEEVAAEAQQPTPVQKPAPKPIAPEQSFDDEADAFFEGTTQGAMLNEESVAARLQRIREAARAQVSEEVEATEEEEEIVDDIISEVLVEELEETSVEETSEVEEELIEDEDEDLIIEESEPTTDDISEFEEPSEDPLEEEISDLLSMDGADDGDLFEEEAEDDADEIASEDNDDEISALLDALDGETDDSADEQNYDDEVEEDSEPIQARILHVKGAALQDLESQSQDELIGYDDDAYEAPENEVDAEALSEIFDQDEDTSPGSSLSDEEEADLMRELAEVEADESEDDEDWGDLLDADTEAVISDEEHLFTDDPEEALASAQDLSSLLTDREADDEVNRLMAETETQLSEPEHTRRKTTIQHLKAAFAARRADGDDTEKGNDSIAYQEDYAMAVKPRRPVLGNGPKTERLQSTEAAPLKLVAAQRIVPDENRAEPAARPTLVKPVRPRRVRGGSAAVAEAFVETEAVATEPVPQENVDFHSYAEHMGVTKLPELLEAAASYMTFIEEFEKFSRPQIMTLVREVMGDAYTREDGLRAFGQLLREGKLIRLEGGRFTVSDGIGFQPN